MSIEEEDFPNLPPIPYLKGFLKLYSSVIGAESESVISSYIEKYYKK